MSYFLQNPTFTTYKAMPVEYWPNGKVGLILTPFSVPKFHTSVSKELKYNRFIRIIMKLYPVETNLLSAENPPITIVSSPTTIDP